MRNDGCSSKATEYPVWNWRWHYETCHNTSMGFIRCPVGLFYQLPLLCPLVPGPKFGKLRWWGIGGKDGKSHPWTGSLIFLSSLKSPGFGIAWIFSDPKLRCWGSWWEMSQWSQCFEASRLHGKCLNILMGIGWNGGIWLSQTLDLAWFGESSPRSWLFGMVYSHVKTIHRWPFWSFFAAYCRTCPLGGKGFLVIAPFIIFQLKIQWNRNGDSFQSWGNQS